MCNFINTMEKLKSSSSTSVANVEFTAFNNYMHTPSKMDDRLASVIKNASGYRKALVLVCGNSGDGKSHLIARLKEKGIISDEFEIYIDATSADKKGMKANEKLKEKLMPLSDSELLDDSSFRLIVAINLGILNDFLKNYGSEFTILQKYVDDQGLFDVLPTWKYEKINRCIEEHDEYYFGHVDFTSFHRYEITPEGLNLDFIYGLFEKIVSDDERNEIRSSFEKECVSCTKRYNCPVYWNYKKIVYDAEYRKYIVEILAESIIKHNVAPSVREINNFFYEIIVGRTFDESNIDVNSTDRLVHFINNLSLNLLFEGRDGLLSYISELDALNSKYREYDMDLISLNLKPSFEKWLSEIADTEKDELLQVKSDLIFCQEHFAKNYKSIEPAVKQTLIQYYIRLQASKIHRNDPRYRKFLDYLYFYNIGNEQKCKELINLIKTCIYMWNGRLGERSGGIINNAVICGKGTERYYIYKIVDAQFQVDRNIDKLDTTDGFPIFASSLRFNFIVKDKPDKPISLDVDYELFDLLTDIEQGYVPTDNDRKQNVNFDSFVRTLLAESESDLHVYSRYDNGITYKLSRDEFDGFIFEKEV